MPFVEPAEAKAASSEFGLITAGPRWRFSQRCTLALARTVAPPLLRAWGRTLRLDLPREVPPGAFTTPPEPAIYVFWHRVLLPIAWIARGRGFGVLVSQHFDGELISQVAGRLGYRLFRGSSTRGGQEALREMTSALAAGQPLALTVDGPRGPCFRAKPGAIELARATGAPIYALHVAPERSWELRSWDRFQVPKPFSRVRGTWAGPLRIAADAGPAEMERARQAMEAMLNDLGAEA